jgi:multidrug resistance efflux pump
MKAAGFTDFERGERGSTAEHLSVLEYKTLKESERAAILATEVENKQNTANAIDKKVENQQARLDSIQEKISVSKQAAITFSEIECMAKKTLFGGKVELSIDDWETISGLAKTGVISQAEVKDLKRQLSNAKKEIRSLKDAFNRLYEETKVFREAVKTAPKRVLSFLQEVISRRSEQREAELAIKKKQKNEPDR